MPRRFWFALVVLLVVAGGAALWTRPAPLITEADVAPHASFVSYTGMQERQRGHVSAPQLIETPEDGRVQLDVGGAQMEVFAASTIMLQRVAPLTLQVRSGSATVRTSDRAVRLVVNGLDLRVENDTILDLDASTRSVTRNSSNVGGRFSLEGRAVDSSVHWAAE